ncbi:hypothetical protein [Persicobacter sp. CCB-QB2]|uniref:hypothetical protein n=1 Tax=Persicobacter sp. CCB-QB2 TaxID=1561025 RepID=UPI0012F9D0F7|nr:hypothetical protein [Persicobacter sp. CCB-QB2]
MEIPQNKAINIEALKNENNEWITEIYLMADELEVLNMRLGEVSKLVKEKKFKAQVEHFQNQFIRQKEVLDIYKNHIHKQEKNLNLHAKNGDLIPEKMDINAHQELKENLALNRKINVELKQNFYQFLEQHY